LRPSPVAGLPAGALAPAHDRAYPQEEARCLRRLGEHLARFLDTAHRYERARHHALTDHLTGLANQRALRERAEQALARAAAGGTTVSVLLADLDGFKAI